MSEPESENGAVHEAQWREVRYEYTPRLADILAHLRATIVVTTYQAGKLLVLGVHDGKLQISFLSFEQPMGVAVGSDRIAIGTRRQIHFLRAAHETAPHVEPHGMYDGCFVPRTSFYTGAIHGHDLAFGRDGLWVVNTLFSCLCTLHEAYSFVPRWRPRFVSQLIDEDRCHLNGLAMQDGRPKFVTVMAEADEAGGWRPNKATTGCVLDVDTNEVVVRGLCMPHSPRLRGDDLWVLNSGYGSIGKVDRAAGRYESVETMPGYTRGLAFAGQFAFVGISKIRETSVFGGVPIAEDRANLRCGIGVVDLVSGQTVAVFQFLSGVEEIFAVDVIPGMLCPLIAGASVDKQERDVWIVPQPGSGE
ncbi:MAG: TIGR03032 family protein [Planctomycetales bacterium]|nr:TIGR03032 family protein [Planctomycetales bacterium]